MSIDLNQYITRDFTCTAFKSVNDKKSYRQIKLENGLQVILVQDLSEVPILPDCLPTTASSKPGSSVQDPYGSLPRKRFRTTSPFVDPVEVGSSSDVDEEEEDTDSESYITQATGVNTGERLAAMSLCVRVGSLDDPEDLQGLCHYTEHVVLMGNEQFPEVNEFDEYVERHCGYSNGTTELECTYYEAEIPNKYLEGCLQRFAACFKKPLFRQIDVECELNPVHNEYVDNFTDDDVRLEHLMCSLARPGHPLRKFTWGNTVSLRDLPASNNINVRDRMVEFFKKHYKANAMCLAVQSQLSLDRMEDMVRLYFSDIPALTPETGDAESPEYEYLCEKIQHLPVSTKLRRPELLPYSPDSLNYIHFVEPIGEGHHLKMVWFFAPLITSYRSKPLFYIASLIGHEGVGSLIAYLRQELLALDLEAGSDDYGFDQNIHQTVLNISIHLTDKGVQRMKEVLSLVQYYLTMLTDLGPQKWYFEEERLRTLSQFRFRNEQPPVKNVTDLARNAFIYPFEHVLVGSHLLWDYNEQLIMNCLKHIRIEKSICFLLSKKEFEQMDAPISTEFWSGVRYKSCPIPYQFGVFAQLSSDQMRDHIHFPKPNEFLSADYSMQSVQSLSQPRVLHEDSTSKLFWLPDLEFDAPKGYISFQFSSLRNRDSVFVATCLELYVSIFDRWVRKLTYPAMMANIDFTIRVTAVGLIFKFDGFSQNLTKLVKLVFENFVRMPIPETLFDTIRTDLLRSYANNSIECSDFVETTNKTVVVEGMFCPLDKRRILYHLTPNQVRRQIDKLLQSSYIQGLVYGNLSEKQACECFIKIRTLITHEESSINFEKIRRVGVRRIPIGNAQMLYKAFSPSDGNIMINFYQQIGSMNLTQQMLLALLVQEMQEPLFSMLRTRENLAYMLYPYHEEFGRIGAFGIMIRSLVNKFRVKHVIDRLDAFLDHFAEHVAALPYSKFEQLKQAKLKLLRAPYINMQERFEDVWNEIACFEYRFDLRELKISALQQITFEMFKDYSAPLFASSQQRRLTLISVGHGESAENTTLRVHPFQLTTFDHKMKALRTALENKKVRFYDQVPESVNPDDIVYKFCYLRPYPTPEHIRIITDLPGFAQLMPFYPSTDRSLVESP